MQWAVPPKRADASIIEALSVEDSRQTLKALATETVSIITLARALHDQDKKTRRELQEEFFAAAPETQKPDFNDSLEGI